MTLMILTIGIIIALSIYTGSIFIGWIIKKGNQKMKKQPWVKTYCRECNRTSEYSLLDHLRIFHPAVWEDAARTMLAAQAAAHKPPQK